MATTTTMVSDAEALVHTLLLALLCPCAHPLACSLTSYLAIPG
jgi:Na+-translocating ferredoxin:NAD+ oxidoreductase RnfD subunit